MPKIDQRIVRTLHQIDSALLENLKTADFQKITVDSLCATANVNRSTFYKYYKDKYDLLDKFLKKVMEEFRQAMSSTDFILATPSTIDDSRYMDNFRRSITFIYENRECYQVLWNAAIDRNIYSEMVDVIQQSMLSKLSQATLPDHDAVLYQELYTGLFASNLMALVSWWFRNSSCVTANDVMNLMNRNMKDGLFATFTDII